MDIGIHQVWLGEAQQARERHLRDGRSRAALACTCATLERLNRDLGAPPAIDPWLDALGHDLQACASEPRHVVNAAIYQAALAVLARRPSHPALPLWHARAVAELSAPALPADDVLRAARFAFEYAVRSGHFPLARGIVAKARAHAAIASSAARVDWLESEALAAWLDGAPAAAQVAVTEALHLGGGYGAWEQGASAALAAGDLPGADRCLAHMAATLDPVREQDVAHCAFLAAARARLGGDDAVAQARIEACLAGTHEAVPPYFVTLWQLGRAHLAVACGHERAASRELDAVLGRASRFYWGFLQFSTLLSRAWLRVRQRRDDEALTDLDAAVSLARASGYRHCDPWRDPAALRDLAAFAAARNRNVAPLATLFAPAHAA